MGGKEITKRREKKQRKHEAKIRRADHFSSTQV